LLIYTNDNNQNLTLSRGDLAKFSLFQLNDFLFFGYGAGNFETIFKIFFNQLDSTFANHAHFDLAEFIGEFGMVGIFILMLLVIRILKKITLISIKNIYLIFFIIFILFFDFSFHIFLIQLIFSLLLSVYIKVPQKKIF